MEREYRFLGDRFDESQLALPPGGKLCDALEIETGVAFLNGKNVFGQIFLPGC